MSLIDLKANFKDLYLNDKEQLRTIFSNEDRILLEGPAGYGKTKTMIGKIAFIMASDSLRHPKKILALTFSVNAAYKIKKKISTELPDILLNKNYSITELNNKIFATNYHGFCRRVLELYGYLIHPKLKDINLLKGIDDSNPEYLYDLNIGLEFEEAERMSNYNKAIRDRNNKYLRSHYSSILEIVQENFLVNNIIPYNAIILLTLELFDRYQEILKFYQKLFQYVFVDEFQDTNIIYWNLLDKIIVEDMNIILMGDPLQRIYGFIGAIPDIMSKAKKKYGMHKINLRTNHRFKSNKFLFNLDKNIRKIAKNPYNPNTKDDFEINIYEAENQKEEAYFILKTINEIIDFKESSTIALLVMSRNKNIEKILDIFYKEELNYFYALYSDEDDEYLKFHKNALEIFLEIIKKHGETINKSICEEAYIKIHPGNSSDIYNSLLILLRVFIDVIFKEYNFLEMCEKINLIKDTLENNSLKQYLGYVDENLIVSTIHGAKGLEWDYVVLPDLEQYSLPNWYSLCEVCDYKQNCNVKWKTIKRGSEFEKRFYDVLNIFYVACTRAKKDVYFSYSKKRIKYNGEESSCNMSCLLDLKGLKANIKN